MRRQDGIPALSQSWCKTIRMTQEESLVLSFLQERPDIAFSRGELARRAAKRKVFEGNPHWVDVPLASLVAKRLVEVDENGDYQAVKTDLMR